MNKVFLTGNLVRDPKIYEKITKITVAVDRIDGSNNTDFFDVVTYGYNKKFADQYLTKGRKVEIEGFLENHKYMKDGKIVFVNDIICIRLEALDYPKNKKDSQE